MQRRSFLRSAAAAVPALGLHDLLSAAAQSSVAGLHVVHSGEDLFGHPHSLGFSTLLFKISSSETSGGLFIIEHKNLSRGGPPLHLHLNQEEWFYVMEGEVAFAVGDQRLALRAGESVLAPRRVPHTFSAVGTDPARMIIAFTPAGKMEQYFQDAPNQPAGASPAEFFRRYDMEYLGPSPFWKS